MDTSDDFIEDVRRALYASKVVAYAQGFDQIIAGSDEYDWSVDPRRDGDHLARRVHHPGAVPGPDPGGVRRGPSDLPSLLRGAVLRLGRVVRRRLVAPRRVGRALAGIPTPAFSSSLAYYDGLRRDRLPAALIQGLRDNFGAHTYRRVDRDGCVPHRVGRRSPGAPRLTPALPRVCPGCGR